MRTLFTINKIDINDILEGDQTSFLDVPMKKVTKVSCSKKINLLERVKPFFNRRN